MHERTVAACQDADRLHCLPAPLLMELEQGVCTVAEYMGPEELLFSTDARLVSIVDIAAEGKVFYHVERALDFAGALRDHRTDTAFRQRDVEYISQDLMGP